MKGESFTKPLICLLALAHLVLVAVYVIPNLTYPTNCGCEKQTTKNSGCSAK
jgi:hypothetical protein